MSVNDIQQIADTLLYEGYNLYPYRPTAAKNQQRWMFGVLYPQAYCVRQVGADDWRMRTECLVLGTDRTVVDIGVRFLHLLDQRVYEFTDDSSGNEPRPTASLQVGQKTFHTWQETVESTVDLELPCGSTASRRTFALPAQRDTIALADECDQAVGQVVRERRLVQGAVEACAERLNESAFRLSVTIENNTRLACEDCDSRERSLLRSLVSAHTILTVEGGEFVSLLDPPNELRTHVEACQNVGTWPVLVGEPNTRTAMLSSPIILYDYPRVAAESPGDFFDGTEIDELLALRVQTLTDEEKREMAGVDERTRNLLERAETLSPERALRLHATMRAEPELIGNAPSRTKRTLRVRGFEIGPGSSVRLRPSGRADAFDVVLNGMMATIQSIEEDFENNVYVTVTVDEDPGKDLGSQGKPGHRFFFRPDEIRPIEEREEGKR